MQIQAMEMDGIHRFMSDQDGLAPSPREAGLIAFSDAEMAGEMPGHGMIA
ncbi:hypothetical protein [Actinomadura sp. BRA 177]|nr:hypothetical protein [Actinomadura sp. BRA 177]NVI86960.1 hypothetical protein [Actinomadura sp. BRA 177]